MKHTARLSILSSHAARGSLRRSLQLLRAACAGSLLASPALGQSKELEPTKANCAHAYESAQESRASGKLQQTRERLAFCARVECPSFVQNDCERWLEEVERELPSVIVSAPGLAPADAAGVTVKLDGVVVAQGLTGEPISIDPGPHEIIVEHADHGSITRRIVAQQGVQQRRIEVAFARPELHASAEAAPPGSGSADFGLRPYSFAAFGVGAVGFGVFAVLGTLGRADQDGLEQDCGQGIAPDPGAVRDGYCLQSRVDEEKARYEREYLIADIGLITGIAGAAVGTVLFVLSETGSTPDAPLEAAGVRFDVVPTRGGAAASLQTTF